MDFVPGPQAATRLILLLTFLVAAPALALGATPAPPAPQAQAAASTSKVGFGCGLLGGTALNLEVATPTLAIRMSIWGQGLGNLRVERVMALNGTRPGQPGTAQSCVPGSPCKPVRARFELSSGSTVAGSRLEGRMFWYEASVDREVSLPLSAIVAPASRRCP